MLIAQLTDTHITVPDDEKGDCYTKLEALQRCVNAINQLETLPDVIVHTGDVVHNGSTAEYKLVKSIMDALRAPYFLTKGNRDSIGPLIQEFSSQELKNKNRDFLQYSVDVLGYQLVAVDTTSSHSNLGLLNFDRLANLDEILREKPESPTLLFMHHPPINFSNPKTPLHEYEDFRMVKNFSEIIDRHPQVIALLCGHIHRSFKGVINTTPLIAMPPLSKILNRDKNSKTLCPDVSFYLHDFSDNSFAGTTAITVN